MGKHLGKSEAFEGAFDLEDGAEQGLGNGLLCDFFIVGNERDGVAIVSHSFDGPESVGGDDGVYLSVDEE
jgi:hypothetical protein